jgi:hypothetical protein
MGVTFRTLRTARKFVPTARFEEIKPEARAGHLDLGMSATRLPVSAGRAGGTPRFIVTSDSQPIETEASSTHTIECRREEKFRSALERYIVDYQKHHTATGGTRSTRYSFFRRLAGLDRR